MRLDQNSSDSQISPVEDTGTTTSTEPLTDLIDNHDGGKMAEQPFVYITDDDIKIDISTTTGLRKTGFSANLYGKDPKSAGVANNSGVKPINTKIAQSPILRRRNSFDNSNARMVDDRVIISSGGSPMFAKSPVYRSIRNKTVTTPIKKCNSSTTNEVNNTWNGRCSKKRVSLQADTFHKPSTANTNTNASNGNLISPILNRKSSNRTSTKSLYDKNGRRIKSTNTSPNKTTCTSPLSQQILIEPATTKNDSQMLEKMKELFSKYTKKSGDREFDDFTTAWVNSNGTLDRTADNYNHLPTLQLSSLSQTKVLSKRSSTISSIEPLQSRENTSSTIVIPRRDRGLSKIPAPKY